MHFHFIQPFKGLRSDLNFDLKTWAIYDFVNPEAVVKTSTNKITLVKNLTGVFSRDLKRPKASPGATATWSSNGCTFDNAYDGGSGAPTLTSGHAPIKYPLTIYIVMTVNNWTKFVGMMRGALGGAGDWTISQEATTPNVKVKNYEYSTFAVGTLGILVIRLYKNGGSVKKNNEAEPAYSAMSSLFQTSGIDIGYYTSQGGTGYMTIRKIVIRENQDNSVEEFNIRKALGDELYNAGILGFKYFTLDTSRPTNEGWTMDKTLYTPW